MKRIPIYILLFLIMGGTQYAPRGYNYLSPMDFLYPQIGSPHLYQESPYTWGSYWYSRAANPFYIYPSYEPLHNPFNSEYIDSLIQASQDRTDQQMKQLYKEE